MTEPREPDDATRDATAPKPARRRADPARVTRRRFLGLVAAGSAGALARPLEAAEPAAPAPSRPAKKPAIPPEVAAEIKNQKDYLSRTLGVIRDFELPPGSEPAFTFRALTKHDASDKESSR